MYNGDYIQAQKLYANALTMRRHCLGANHSLTATLVSNQANLAMEMGDLGAAEMLETRAVRMWSIGLGASHPYVARGLDALAEVVALRGQLARAQALYDRALAIRLRTLGQPSGRRVDANESGADSQCVRAPHNGIETVRPSNRHLPTSRSV